MKKKIMYRCSKCGYLSYGYFGKCPSCNSWNTLEEEIAADTKKTPLAERTKKAQPLVQVLSGNSERIQTNIEEFNRVMGGGIVRDSISILTAKPGSGKSTLLLQVAQDLAAQGQKVLYASGEESETQIKARANRILTGLSENIWVISTTSMDFVLEEIKEVDPDFIIIDSIQTFTMSEFSSRPGTPTQTMECAYKMTEMAKNLERPRMVFLVGQMTKEDELAGVRALEHLVDTVLVIDGDSSEELRTLMTTKNRYGSTGEMGFFIMTEKGMESLDNPSVYFMTRRGEGQEMPGSSLSVIREGTRPIVLETEALTSKSFMPYPSRIGECMRREHLSTLISILEERAEVRLIDKNVVVKTMGGIKLKETASNLSVMMSILSSLFNRPISTNILFIADVGLTGELKNVPSLDARLREASRMGFGKVYIPNLASIRGNQYGALQICKKNHIRDVIAEVFS